MNRIDEKIKFAKFLKYKFFVFVIFMASFCSSAHKIKPEPSLRVFLGRRYVVSDETGYGNRSDRFDRRRGTGGTRVLSRLRELRNNQT